MRWRRLGARRHDLHRTDAQKHLAAERERMVREQIEARGLRDPELLAAFGHVPRHLFVEGVGAYEDRALPLSSGQTISQPYIVAAMTDAARPPAGWTGAKVLEVGTGSGYQAAILAELGAQVASIERHAELSEWASGRLIAAGYPQVRLLVGDGTLGDPLDAPWDVILVTAAGPSVPQPLLEQLATNGGRLVMPIGTRDGQTITRYERHGDEVTSHSLERVVFVPLIGEYGFGEE